MAKSNTQINFEKAHLIINVLKETVKNHDNMQMYLVRQAYNALNNEDKDLAYQIVNEGFNQCFIAGYKYTEFCDILQVKGEFREMAQNNPLIHL